MQRSYSNRHHGVPRSFLGSSEGDGNLTVVDAEEHTRFHEMAGHLPPDYFIRKAILSAVDWRSSMGKVLPVEIFANVLDEVRAGNWHSMYQDKTVRTRMHSENENHSFARAAIHIQNHLCDEQYAVSDAIYAVQRNGNIAPERVGFREDILDFFQKENPFAAIRAYLLDSTKTDLKWVKPLELQIRSRLLEILRKSQPENKGDYHKRNMEDLLQQHRECLIDCINGWEPRIQKFETFIMQNSRKILYKEFLDRRKKEWRLKVRNS